MLIEQFVSKSHLNMASAIGLTPREFRALLAVCLKGARSPPEIADIAGMPRSKIYEVLDLLVSKKILQSDNSKYSVSASSLADIRRTYERHSKDFGRFLRDLEEYASRRTEPFLEMARKKLRDLFVELDYSISDLPETEEEFLREQLKRMVQFVATSPTSGNRVGVLFMDQRKRSNAPLYYLISELNYSLKIHSVVCAYSPDSPKDMIDELNSLSELPENDAPRPRMRRRRPHLVMLSLSELNDVNIRKKIGDHFVDFDNQWRHVKRDLQNLSKPLEDFKRTLARIMTTMPELRRNIENIENFRDTLREVVDRVGADIRASEELYKSITEEYSLLIDMLEVSKRIPNESDITKISGTLDQLQATISNNNRELDVIKEEVSSFQKHDARYSKYGFQINPFIFTVPFSAPKDIVNQERSRNAFDTFINDVASGSENRTLVIADEFGKGKTHLMYYFKKLISDNKYGKILPLYIKCQPRYPEIDLIDLYSQIILEVVKQWESIIDQQSVGKLKEILNKAGIPRDINEFMSNLRNILFQVHELGYNHIILMIDEFENMLPEKLISGRPDSEPRTLLQLKLMMDIQDLAFVIATRKQTWSEWKDLLSSVLSNKETQVIELDSFNERNAMDLINQRLEMKKDSTRSVKISAEAIKSIVALSSGNPRHIIRYAREALRRAILSDKEHILKEDIIEF
jgi:sugar-specific transcriptional regulator TrmB/Cdc6-like AAA superfamily ATPase